MKAFVWPVMTLKKEVEGAFGLLRTNAIESFSGYWRHRTDERLGDPPQGASRNL